MRRPAKSLDRLIAEGALRADDRAHYYLYRQIMGEHSQLGLVAVASCAEYSDNTIRKHEFTRPAKEDDRVAHLEALDAQTGPVFVTYPADAGLDELLGRIASGEPGSRLHRARRRAAHIVDGVIGGGRPIHR